MELPKLPKLNTLSAVELTGQRNNDRVGNYNKQVLTDKWVKIRNEGEGALSRQACEAFQVHPPIQQGNKAESSSVL